MVILSNWKIAMQFIINNINTWLILYLATIFWSFSHELFSSKLVNKEKDMRLD